VREHVPRRLERLPEQYFTALLARVAAAAARPMIARSSASESDGSDSCTSLCQPTSWPAATIARTVSG